MVEEPHHGETHFADVETVIICGPIKERLAQMVREYPSAVVYDSLEDILADDTVYAVHLVTQIPMYAEQCVAVPESGKHCACTMPIRKGGAAKQTSRL